MFGVLVLFVEEILLVCEFVNSMVYDLIGFRFFEMFIIYCLGKVFKGLYVYIFGLWI